MRDMFVAVNVLLRLCLSTQLPYTQQSFNTRQYDIIFDNNFYSEYSFYLNIIDLTC